MAQKKPQQQTILFVIAQAGQAAYCMPLWEKWLDNPPGDIVWHIWGSDDALRVMKRTDELPLVDKSWPQNPNSFDVLQNGAYDLIISSASLNPQEILIAQKARKHHIKHIQFIDTWYDYAHRINNSNPPGCLPDEIWLIDDMAQKEAIAQGLSPETLKTIGHPVWEQALSQEKNTAAENIVVFAGQPISKVPALKNLGYNEHRVWDLLLDFKEQNPDLIQELIYAPHPSQTDIPDHFTAGTRLIKPSENPLIVAGTMISMFTALMIEGYLRGQKIISFQPGLNLDNKCALSRNNLIPLETSSDMGILKTAFEEEQSQLNERIFSYLSESLDHFEQNIIRACAKS